MIEFAAIGLSALAAGLLVADWRDWLPARSMLPWWRRQILTLREDLRVGAVAVASVSALIALATAAQADSLSDRYAGADRVQGIVVATQHGQATVAVPSTNPAVVTRVAVPDASADVGDRLGVLITRVGARLPPSSAQFDDQILGALLLGAVAIGASAASLRPGAARRLIVYRQ